MQVKVEIEKRRRSSWLLKLVPRNRLTALEVCAGSFIPIPNLGFFPGVFIVRKGKTRSWNVEREARNQNARVEEKRRKLSFSEKSKKKK